MSAFMAERAARRVSEAAADAVEYIQDGQFDDADRVLAAAARDLNRACQQIEEARRDRT